MPDVGYDDIARPLNTGVGATAPAVNTEGSRSAAPSITIVPMDGSAGEQIERGLREGIEAIAQRDTQAGGAMKQLADATRDAALEMHAAVQTMRETPPPIVHVEVPARKSVSEFERNGAGDITRVTQTERHA